jgi:PAS domain S-box-containing protein
MSKTRRRLLLTTLALYACAIFVVDIFTPLGIEVWVLNVPVILVPVLLRKTRMVLIAGVACSVMVLLGSVLSPPGGNPLAWDVLNRGMGLTTMGVIVAMAVSFINKSNQLDDVIRSLHREIAEHDRTHRSLVASEERLRLAVEGAQMGTFDIDLRTGRMVSSATHLRMLGYEAEAEGESLADLWMSWVHPDDQAYVRMAREQALCERSLYSVEYRIRRAHSGAIGWLAVFGCYYYDALGEAVRFLGVSFDITGRKEMEREIRRKEVEREILEITDRKQREIGQELHDGVGQLLTGLGLMAQTLTQRLPEDSPEQRIAVRLVAGFNQLHQQVRALARGLVPVEMEAKGLWAALDDLATSMGEQSGIPVTFQSPEWVEMPDHATSMELHRIAQEAVSNALRHGRPRKVHLTIVPQPNGLRLRIMDDGVGLADRPDKGKGLGIRIMEYRASLIGAALRIRPGQEGGTVVTVTLPGSNANEHEDFGTAAGINPNPDCR